MPDKPTYEELEQRVRELEKKEANFLTLQKELLESRQVIEGILNAVPARIFWKDKDLVYLGCNKLFAHDAGYEDPKDVVGKDDYQMGWLDQVELYRNDDLEVIASGEPKFLIEEPQTTPEGKTITLLTSKMPLHSPDGEIRGVLGTYLDITERKNAENATKLSEERYRQLIQTASDAIYLVSADGKVLDTNQAACSMLERTREEILQLDLQGIDPDFTVQKFQDFWETVPFNEPRIFETTHIAKNGTRIPVEISCQKFKIDDAVFYFGIARDITDRKKSEEALRESEETFKIAMEATKDGLFDWNLVTGEIYYSPGWKEMLGYLPHELPNDFSVWERLTDPADAEKSWQMQQELIKRKRNRFEIEFRMKHKKGHWVDILSRAKAIFNEKNEATRIVGTHVDISARKETEKTLRESEERLKELKNIADIERQRLHTLLDSMVEGTLLIDASGDILWLNKAAMQLYEFATPEETFISLQQFQKRYKVRHPDGRELPLSEDKPAFRALRGECVIDHQLWVTNTLTGKEWFGSFNAMPILDKRGQVTQAVITVVDITDRIRAEESRKRLELALQQTQKMESIGTLAGGIAHEFNNILGIIIGNNEFVMEDLPAWSSARKSAEEIRVASFRARDVVKQLLLFSRKDESMTAPMDVKQVITESMKMIRSSIPANIEISQNIADDVPSVLGNATQINQILINLCSNAADAMLQTGGLILIELNSEVLGETSQFSHLNLPAGRYIKLKVRDTGCGMDRKTLERVFEPYFTTKEIGKGTGIGLAVVHGIVESHNGIIWAESAPGEGTAFTILFPAYHGQVQQAAERKITVPAGSEKILIVDDEALLLNLGKRRLEQLGYSVIGATNPREALEIFKADPDSFDLIITDMAMPHMTGEQLVSEIFKIRPKIPTILCTGYSEMISAEKARQLGFSAFVLKPIDKTEFAVIVRKVLDEARG